MLIGAFADQMHCRLRQAIDFRTSQANGPRLFHGRHHGVEYGIDDKDFFLRDAQQIVIEGGAIDDAAGGSIEVGRLIDDHGRIPRSRHNGSLAAVERGTRDGGAAGDADERDFTMLE